MTYVSRYIIPLTFVLTDFYGKIWPLSFEGHEGFKPRKDHNQQMKMPPRQKLILGQQNKTIN